MYVFRAVVQICLFAVVLSYKNRCPYFLEWSILSKQCSNEEPSHCMKDDDSKHFIQRCRKWEWVANGSFTVLIGRYIYYKDCSPDTYQPYIYKSNEGYNCSFAKSLCNELGHVTVENGTTVTNRLCGCDLTKGYTFVVGSTTGFCNPELEDCSCYQQQCNLGQNLDQDKICKQKITVDPSDMERSTITRPFVDKNEEIRSGNRTQQLDFFNFLNENRKYILTALIIISCVLISAKVSVIVLCKMKDTNEETSSAKPLVNKDTKDKQDLTLIPVTQSTNGDILEDKHFRSARNDRQESTHIITTQSVRGEKSKNFADILILDLEYPSTKEKVSAFQLHLLLFAANLGFKGMKIKIFDEVYNDACPDKQIMLPELLASCKYLFVHISESHKPEHAIRKGLCEKDLISYMSQTPVYSNIKTVCACEGLRYPDEYRTDFNYFEYKQSIGCETYKRSLRLLLNTIR